jgi:putative transposase
MNTSLLPKRTRARTPNNRTTTGFRISDELWAVLAPLLPVRVNTHRFGGGRPRVPDRRCADAIFYVLRTGCQWEALNQTELCAKSTAHDRFQEWVEADVFLKLWKAGVEQFDELQGIAWDWLSMDGAMTKCSISEMKTRLTSSFPACLLSVSSENHSTICETEHLVLRFTNSAMVFRLAVLLK